MSFAALILAVLSRGGAARAQDLTPNNAARDPLVTLRLAIEPAPGTGMIVGGAVLTTIATTGVVFGSMFFMIESMAVDVRCLCSPQVNHAISALTFLGSGSFLVPGIAMLVVGVNANAAAAQRRQQSTVALAPLPLNCGGGLALGMRF